jgi:hypothetical protein
MDSGAASSRSILTMAPMELREAIRRLEVKLVLAENSEADAQRQNASLKGQVVQLEKQLVLRQVTDIRRKEGREDLEELLQEDRHRRGALHDELRQVRALLHSERDEHYLQVEQLKSALAENQRHMVFLEGEVTEARRCKESLQATIHALGLERDAADEAYNALYDESNIALTNALEEQEFAHRLDEVSRTALSCDADSSPKRIEPRPGNVSEFASVFGSLSAANDAWLEARCELDAVKQQLSQRENSLSVLRCDRDALATEVKTLQLSLAALRSAHAEVSANLETKMFELSDEQSRVGELEELLRSATQSKAIVQDELSRVLSANKMRTFSSQTTLSLLSLTSLEHKAAEGENAREMLAAERVIWSGRIRAAEVKCDAMKSLRAATISPPPRETAPQDSELHSLNATLRSQVADLQRQQKRHDSAIDTLTSENATLKERIQRLQGLVSSSNGSNVSAIQVGGSPSRYAPVSLSVRDNELRVLNALDEAAVLRETVITREKQIAQMAIDAQRSRCDFDEICNALSRCKEVLLVTQEERSALTREMQDVRQELEAMALQNAANGSTVEVTHETARVNAAALREAYEVVSTVLQVLRSAISSSSGTATLSARPLDDGLPVDDLLRSAHEASAEVKCLRAECAEWEDASLWLMDQLHEISRWLRQGPVAQLLTVTNSALHDNIDARDERPRKHDPDFMPTSLDGPIVRRLEPLLQRRRDQQNAASPSLHRSTSRGRSASPYSGSAPTPRRVWGDGGTNSLSREESLPSTQQPLTIVETVLQVRDALGMLLDSIASQSLEIATMRKSMYDVKSAFLSEMEAREELEMRLHCATSGQGWSAAGSTQVNHHGADELSVEICSTVGN